MSRSLPSPTAYDVVALGETMLRLSPPGKQRFAQSSMAEMHVGGSESNTAVGLARLSHPVTWLSRLTDNPIGQWIAQSLASQGVDTDLVRWTDRDRIGTYYLEQGAGVRAAEVFYDRANSAMSRMTAGDLPVDLFQPGRAKLLHTTGITVGISEDASSTASRAIDLAKSAGWQVSFDLNYRGRLWGPSEAAQRCRQFLDRADLIISPRRDLANLYELTGERKEIASQMHALWPQALCIVTDGDQGAFAISSSGEFQEQPAFPTETVERLGSGDAFAAGLLSSWLRNHPLVESLRWGCAAAAMKHTIMGDLPLFDAASVERLVRGDHAGGLLR